MSENHPEKSVSESEKLEWLETIKHISEIRTQENQGIRDKMLDKIKSNPFVPIGMLATSAALGYGVYSMRKGNKKRSQLMMRARIICQGFTIAALLLGVVVATKTKPSES